VVVTGQVSPPLIVGQYLDKVRGSGGVKPTSAEDEKQHNNSGHSKTSGK